MDRAMQEFWVTSTEMCLVLFFMLVPPLLLPSHPANEWSEKWIISPTRYAKNQLVTRHKRISRDTTGLSSNYLKIIFIFSLPKCGKVVTGSKIGKKMRNVIFESATNVWLTCALFVTHLRPIYDSPITHPIIHLRAICNNVRRTSNLSMTRL